MKRRHLEPITINEDVWFYVNPKGFQFVVWTKKPEVGPRIAVQFRVPFSKIKNFYCSKHGEVKPDVHPSCPLCHKEKPTQEKECACKGLETSLQVHTMNECYSLPHEKPIEEWEEDVMEYFSENTPDRIIDLIRHLLEEQHRKSYQEGARMQAVLDAETLKEEKEKPLWHGTSQKQEREKAQSFVDGVVKGREAALQELRKEVEEEKRPFKSDGEHFDVGSREFHNGWNAFRTTVLNLIDARMK